MKRRKMLKYLDKVLHAHDEHGILSNPIKYLKFNISNVPTKLYKFRKCTTRNLQNLRNETIFLSRATSFSDSLDVSILFDDISKTSNKKIVKLYKKECLSNYIDNFYSKYNDVDDFDIFPEEVKKILDTAYDSNFVFLPNKVERCIRRKSKHFLISKLEQQHPNLSKIELKNLYKKKIKFIIEQRKKMALKLDEVFSKHGNHQQLVNRCILEYSDKIKYIKKFTRDETFVCSLTDDFKNLSMWEKYADYYKGFCIEYTLDIKKVFDSFLNDENEIKMVEALYSLFKVNYVNLSKKQTKISSYKYMTAMFDNSTKNFLSSYRNPEIIALYTYQKLIKDICFDFEREWRIILFHIDNQLVHLPLTSAIYIGRDITFENYNELLTIAKKLQIPVYKQRFDENSNTYNYDLIKN